MAGAVKQARKRSLNDYYLPMLGDDDKALRSFVMYILDAVSRTYFLPHN
jgi:hypothetical protein